VNTRPHNPLPYDTCINIIGYTDSDWAGNSTTRKSVGGCLFGLGHTNASKELIMAGLIHWQAKSQSIVALSTLEAEYIACSVTPERFIAST